MMLALVALLVAVPILELMVLFEVGRHIGFLPTVTLVLGLSMLGAWLLQTQGLKALLGAQEALARGRMPVAEVIDGAGLSVAGALLLTPGLITDFFGFLLLVPPIRSAATAWVMRRLLGIHAFDRSGPERDQRGRRPPDADGDVIEGEFHRIDDDEPPSNGKAIRR